MLEKDFAIIAVRLLALYIIVMTANAFPRYLGMIGSKIGMDPESKCIFAFEHYCERHCILSWVFGFCSGQTELSLLYEPFRQRGNHITAGGECLLSWVDPIIPHGQYRIAAVVLQSNLSSTK